MKEELQELIIHSNEKNKKNKNLRNIYLKLTFTWFLISLGLISLSRFIQDEIKRCYPPSCNTPMRHIINDLNLIISFVLILPVLIIIIKLIIRLETRKNTEI